MSKKGFSDEELMEYANVLKIQKFQQDNTMTRVGGLNKELDKLSNTNKDNSDELDNLLEMAQKFSGINNFEIKSTDVDRALSISQEREETINESLKEFEELQTVALNDSGNWKEFYKKNLEFANKFNLDLDTDPFSELLSDRERLAIINRVNQEYELGSPDLDKYDYMFASLSGILSGLIDIFIIGEPLKAKNYRLKEIKGISKSERKNLTDSKLNQAVHDSMDKIIFNFSSFIYDYDKKNDKLVKNTRKKFDDVAGAIGYLEERFKVPYDARYASDLGMSKGELNMNPKNHHLKSLSHQPDIIGLFFSLLDQFKDTTSVIDQGKIKIIKNKNGNFQLQGSNFFMKIISGILNWLGHLMSDMAGSSGTRGHKDKTGAGVPLPFYALLQLMSGNFVKDNQGNMVTLAKIAEKSYLDGYDARFSITLAIPVTLNELLIRIFWTIKEVYYKNKSLSEMLNINRSREVQRLLLVGHGSLCMVDGVDGYIRSAGGKNLVVMLSRLNLVGWARFGLASFREVTYLYKTHENLKKLDEDLEKEWIKLHTET